MVKFICFNTKFHLQLKNIKIIEISVKYFQVNNLFLWHIEMPSDGIFPKSNSYLENK